LAAPNPKPPRKPAPDLTVKAGASAAEEHARTIGMSNDVAAANRHQVTRELTRQAQLTPHTMAHLHAVHLPDPDSDDGRAYMAAKNGRAVAYYSSLGSHPSVYATPGTEADEPRPAIWLHPHWVGDSGDGRLSAAYRRSVESNFSSSSGAETPMEEVIAHEYGHHVAGVFQGPIGIDGQADFPLELAPRFLPALNDALGANRFGRQFDTNRPDCDLLAPVRTGFAGDAKDKIPGALLNTWVRRNKELITEKVSGYGATNFNEMLAEIWAEYSTKGPSARPHITVLGDLMKQIAEEVRA
jgi:hypothetical protein